MNDSDLMTEVRAYCNKYELHPHSIDADAYLDELKGEEIEPFDNTCELCGEWLHPIDFYCLNESCSNNINNSKFTRLK